MNEPEPDRAGAQRGNGADRRGLGRGGLRDPPAPRARRGPARPGGLLPRRGRLPHACGPLRGRLAPDPPAPRPVRPAAARHLRPARPPSAEPDRRVHGAGGTAGAGFAVGEGAGRHRRHAGPGPQAPRAALRRASASARARVVRPADGRLLLTPGMRRPRTARQEVAGLLAAAGRGTVGERLERLSGRLLGRPYVVAPLGGGPGRREVLTATLDGFDCVTYVETVLALARSRAPAGFRPWLRRLRYRDGRVGWVTRNHYMTGWARENAARGYVADLTRGAGTVARERTLSVVEGLAPRRTRFRCFPKGSWARLWSRLRTGDLLLFVSTRRDLDVFHVGLVMRRGDELLLRHAPRSQERVVEQPLRGFLQEQRLS